MPICTSCTQPVSYLYTVYGSQYNLRLEQCATCHEFVDPYVEHDELTVLLDLILLKRGVYRHLLFNRGEEPRRLSGKSTDQALRVVSRPSKERLDRWMLLLKLGTTLIALDAFIRWNHLSPKERRQITPWNKEILLAFLRFFLGTAAETFAFHGGIVLSCYVIMGITEPILTHRSNIHKELRLSMISLSLFYSSLTKLFLLLLLTIWLPASSLPSPRIENALPSWLNHLRTCNSNFVADILELLDDNNLDREWIVRNILGGISAGFGLRVILDIHPIFTTLIILSGWFAKNAMATFVSGWVGGNARAGEAWLAYSIP